MTVMIVEHRSGRPDPNNDRPRVLALTCRSARRCTRRSRPRPGGQWP